MESLACHTGSERASHYALHSGKSERHIFLATCPIIPNKSPVHTQTQGVKKYMPHIDEKQSKVVLQRSVTHLHYLIKFS